jgi:7,8-dihydropterin-6-yl-methyl-4-(beta-D-ribofuranosyl)aminobenzene 5'-phosphate synthase
MHNTRQLNVDLSQIDQIVISHNHWDHTGGLDQVRRSNHRPEVYVPRSFPYSMIRNVERTRGDIIAVDEPQEICSHVYSTGEMGTRIKEQSLILNTAEGLVIVTGCSHQGISNIVRRAKGLFDKEILLVLGGFHLMQHTDDQIMQIIRTFKECGVQKCGATHCTGDHQIELFRQAYGEDYVPIGTGRRITVSENGLEITAMN